MPGFRTHYLFGKSAMEENKLADIYQCIKDHPLAYQLGQQGPDIFFYNPFTVFSYPASLGTTIHNASVMSFFSSLFEARSTFIRKKDRAICDAYLMGFIGHYTLDVIAHPYIQYRVKRRKNKDRPKYAHGIHVILETDIDLALQRHYLHLDAGHFCPEVTIAVTKHEKSVISQLLARAIQKTYPDQSIRAWEVKLSIFSTYMLTKLTFDPHGWKKKLVRLLDQYLYQTPFYSAIIANNETKVYRDPLNLRHLPWTNPWNTKATSKQNFYEMMDEAKSKYIKRLDLYDKMMKDAMHSSVLTGKALSNSYYHKLNVLLIELGDYSYSRGVELK